jgi:formylglycine-generating enzyme required for sulfatase activity
MKTSSFIACSMITSVILPTAAIAHPHCPMPRVANEAPAAEIDEPAGEVPAVGAHEAPAGEVPVATEMPVAPSDMKPLDAAASKKRRMVQVRFGDATLDLLWVKPGTFMMGSPKDEPLRHPFENQHRVKLTQGFYLGQYEVTQAQYKWVMGAIPSGYIEDGYKQGEDIPVGGVSWEYAIAFCKKLTAMERKAGRLPEGMGFQLPTEAEWEYACRAGTTTAYSWGNDADVNKANYGVPNARGFTGIVQPVGQYRPNPWGFHDMHGNVYEWCNDHAGANDGGGPYPEGDAIDPQGKRPGRDSQSKVQRGGCFWSHAAQIRSAYRHSHPSYDRIHFKGFRVTLKGVASEVSLPATGADAPAGEVPVE